MQNYILILIVLFSASDLVTSATPERIRNERGKIMQSHMNSSMDPCTNFYKFACGCWGKRYRLGRNELSFDVLDVLTNKVNKFFKDAVLFKNMTFSPNDNLEKLLAASEVQRIKDYYRLCRSQKGTKYQPYLKILNFPGGWPALNRTWSEEHFDMLNLTAQLKLFNVKAFFDVTVSPHYQNATRNALYIYPATFPFFPPSSFLGERDPVIEHYMVEVIRMSFGGLGIRRRVIAKITESILEFETELAQIISDSERTEDEITLATLRELLPSIDFEGYLEIVTKKKFPETQEVVLLFRSYFSRLIELLDETDSEVLANYLFYKFTSAIETSDKNEKHCTNEIINYLGFALSPIYGMGFNNERDNKDVQMIGESIRAEFSKIIENTTWIDQKTAMEASAKVKNVIITVSGSSSSDAYEAVKKDLLDINLDLKNYHESYFQLIAHNIRKNFKNLEILNNNDVTDVNTAKVNAHYLRKRNHILIPTNILQTPTYHYNLPYSVKYGALGSIIGHEIMHSLDATGTRYDSSGAVREWWSELASSEYVKRSKCIQHQYGNYTREVTDIPMESLKTSTLNENIADNGGLRLSYHAYQNWLKENPDKIETLPHVNLTNNQLFFLSFAQFYCQKISPAGMIVTLIADEHGLNEYRVIGTLTNFEKFAEAFNCPVGSNMNPSKKCRVW